MNNKIENNQEKELLKLQQAKEESDKRLLNAEIVIGSITTISFLLFTFVALYMLEPLKYYVLSCITFGIGFLLFIAGFSFCLYIEQKAGFYKCSKCNHKHVPSFKQVLIAPHICRTRYMKCPHCNQKSWQKKTIK